LHVPLQYSLLALAGRGYPLLVQLLLEVGEHLEELALRGKLALCLLAPASGEAVGESVLP